MVRYTQNAKITDTFLGYKESHFTFYIYFELEHGGGGMGGFALDEWDEKAKKRIPHQMAAIAIQRILEVLEVKSWEEVPGQFIRVVEPEWGKTIKGIGHGLKDKWFIKDEFIAEFTSN